MKVIIVARGRNLITLYTDDTIWYTDRITAELGMVLRRRIT